MKATNKRTCCICGTEFPKRGRQRTCGGDCSQTLHRMRYNPLPAMEDGTHVRMSWESRQKKGKFRTAGYCMDLASPQYILDRIKVNPGTGCWEWQRSLNPKTGYGQIRVKPYTAHRLAFLLWKGRYPSRITRHLCHNRACCNPDHLAEGSHADNYRDSADRHAEAAKRRRGRIPATSVPVVVHGKTYPSKAAAMRDLGLTWKRVTELNTL